MAAQKRGRKKKMLKTRAPRKIQMVSAWVRASNPKADTCRGQPDPDGAAAVLRLNRPHHRINGRVQEEEHQHLGQTRKRILPDRVANENEAATEQRQPFIE